MAYYNFTTFDIIGPSGPLKVARNPLLFGLSSNFPPLGFAAKSNRNVIEAINFLGLFHFVAIYPAMRLAFRLLEFMMPTFTAKRVAHLAFTTSRIEKRLDTKTDRKDVITYASFHPVFIDQVLRHNDERGMTRSEIISTSRTLLNAGSETTSSVLAAATYYLLQNPEMLHRVQSEVRAAFGTADNITLRAVSTPGLLPYLEAVIQEAVRCFPPIPATLPRIVGPAGAVIDGYYVPKDVSTVLSISKKAKIDLMLL
ncbi:MAG: hypothetical protein Q9226_005693 [Calogaya cf. arnoldii]